jgi:hypothetical protein
MSSDGTGLMAFWAEIEDSYIDRFRQWHNSEHIPERVSIPGFILGKRYLGHGTRGFYLMMYETRDTAVLGSQAYLERLNDPSDWTKETLPHFRNPARNIYTRLADEGETDLFEAPYIYSVRFNAEAVPDGLISQLVQTEGAGRISLYEIDSAISGIETSERAIYGGGPGEQRYLLLVECSIAAGGTDSALRKALTDASEPWNDVFLDCFAIDYTLAKSGGA